MMKSNVLSLADNDLLESWSASRDGENLGETQPQNGRAPTSPSRTYL